MRRSEAGAPPAHPARLFAARARGGGSWSRRAAGSARRRLGPAADFTSRRRPRTLPAPMGRFIAWRLVQFPLVLAVIYVITFLLAWVAPGSPFERNDRKLDPAAMERIKQKMHAQSAWTFLGFYPWNLLRHGDFGYSLSYEEWTVNDILGEAAAGLDHAGAVRDD